jgi:hypothetical protein
LHENCLLKHDIEGKIVGTGRRGKIHKQLLDSRKENTGHWRLKEEVLDRALPRNRCGRGYGPVGKLHESS